MDDKTRTVADDGQSGALIGGRYELIRQVGEGGMGEVFEAFDHTLHRRVGVAQKQFHTSQVNYPRVRMRLDSWGV